MSIIEVNHLSFGYEGTPDTIFENVSFTIDSDWKLGFVGRNGRGKTTFLRLLMAEFAYHGTITASVRFDYFPHVPDQPELPALEVAKSAVAPFREWEREMDRALKENDLERYGDVQEQYSSADGYQIDELLIKEIHKIGMRPEALNRPFKTLSGGEQTRLLIAALFLRKGGFLLIDEPTNHLDVQGRQLMADYLCSKKGFILVSHDRAFLDRTVDHILSINRGGIEVQKGNYSSWQVNRKRADERELQENNRLKKDIARLQETSRQKSEWSDKIERSKIGNHVADRGFVGHQAAKMMKRAKAIENRQREAAEQKEKLLKNIEKADPLKIHPLEYPKEKLMEAENLSINYGTGALFHDLRFTVRKGQRIAVVGPNGCGKSSLLKLCLGENIPYSGKLLRGGHLEVSYVPQDVSYLYGIPADYASRMGVDACLFLTILRKLDFPRRLFEIPMEEYSAGQKKKSAIALSLSQSAHLYIWDEPLNFIDLISREQLEQLLIEYRPTMLFVEHDEEFVRKVSTSRLNL